MVSISSKGDFKNFENFAKRVKTKDVYKILNVFGSEGVNALSEATPKDTGNTAASWRYEIEVKNGGYTINWYNTNTVYGSGGPSVAILLQYGHATRNGAWVKGTDFINPAMKGIFDRMAEALWKEVTK